MKYHRRWITAIVVGMFVFVGLANAAVTQTIGTGSAVGVADRIATFDSIVTGTDLSTYTEDGLFITVADTAYVGFNAFGDGSAIQLHYGTSGNTSWVTIKTTDALPLFALEMRLGNGWSGAASYIYWETWSGGVKADSGSFTTAIGNVGGWSDPLGFDEMRIAAFNQPTVGFGTFQAIALDDVKAALEVDLLAVNSGNGGDFLASIDIDTAVLTNLGNTALKIDGIAMGNGVLYAADNDNHRLVTLDQATGALDTIVGSFLNAGTIEAMAYRQSDNALFGIDLTYHNFVRFNTSTGEATVIGPLGTSANLAGLSFVADGTLFSIAHSGGDLYTINANTGAATLVATGSGTGPLGLATHPLTDVLYTVSYTGGGSGLLETVNRTTAVRTLVGSVVGGNQIEGLTFRSGVLSVAQVADLTISKTDSADPVVAGTAFSYTVRVDNTGTAPAENVVVTDTLPAGVTVVSTSGCVETTGVPTCSLGSIAPAGYKEYTITVDVDPAVTGIITNNASVVTSSPESDTGNNATSENTQVNAVAELSITKMDSSDPASSGGSGVLVYTIEVSNAGPSDATNVVVTDTLSPLALFEHTTGCLNDPNGVPYCQLGTIPVGGSASYMITVNLTRSDDSITNSASVSSAASDPTGDNNVIEETTDLVAVAIPTLDLLGLVMLVLLLGGVGWVSIRRT